MICLNIYGMPCSNKSKFLSTFYSNLAYKGHSVSVIGGDINIDINKNMFHILGSIVDRIDSAKHEDIVITTTPIMLQPIYYRQNGYPEPDMFEIICSKMYRKYQNMNVLIIDPDNSYLYRDLLDLFQKYDIPYEAVTCIEDYACLNVLSKVNERLKG